MTDYHIPVLAEKSLELLNIVPDGCYADLTFGGGGHSRKILEQLGDKGSLFSFDQDMDARSNIIDDSRFHFIESNFRFMRGQLRARGIDQLDGILADLGVSSHHFDTPHRGFSFRFNADLDMRMNAKAGFSAKDVVNKYSAQELTKILGEYGEIDTPYKVANCIVRSRENGEINTAEQLIEAVAPCTPKKAENKFLSKLFQAIRIEVNGEIEALKMALEQSLKMLKPGGRLVVISYHSLEDRLVKNFMRNGSFETSVEVDFFGNRNTPFHILTKKAIAADQTELTHNPRSRSAKLRAAEKLQPK